jgi:hypothetical protein
VSTAVNAPAQRRCLLFRFEQYQLCRHLRLQQFYDRLLAALRAPAMHDGDWQLLQYAPAWDGNWTPDCFIAYFWQGADDGWKLVVVNYAGNQSVLCRNFFSQPSGPAMAAGGFAE